MSPLLPAPAFLNTNPRVVPPVVTSSMASQSAPRTMPTPMPVRRPVPPLRYVTAEKAALIDRILMSETIGHTLTQLMELAGVAVAHATVDFLSVLEKQRGMNTTSRRIVVVCGPGNNGGDGLVAARHLMHFGYDVAVMYPKTVKRDPFPQLVNQLKAMDAEFVDRFPEHACLIVDSVFGFSFDGSNGVREPFRTVLRDMNRHEMAKLLCVDVPSGWDVDKGPVFDDCVRMPDALISLTVPKSCVQQLDVETASSPTVVHYIGGRFVPPGLCRRLDFDVPEYCGVDMITRIA